MNTIKLTATEAAALHNFMQALWNNEMNADRTWWDDNLSEILSAALTARRLLNAFEPVRVEAAH